MKVSLVTRTDVHLSPRNPESRKDNYTQTILGKLEQIGHIARERNAAAVLDNGDLFHLKEATKNPPWMLRQLVEIHKDYNCPTIVNCGNHDVVYGNAEYLPQQPLGLLYATGTFVEMGDLTIERDDLTVRIVGIPYDPHLGFETLRAHPLMQKGDEDVLVASLHAYATPEGGELWGKDLALSYGDLSCLDPDVWLLGHYHIDQGVVEVMGKHFINVGAISRGALTTDNLSRVPKVGTIDIEKSGSGVTIEVGSLELEVAPADEVFDLVKHEQAKEEAKDIEEFVRKLSQEAVDENEDDLAKHINGLEFDQAVKESALGYLERAGG
jgi:hypothetical protein